VGGKKEVQCWLTCIKVSKKEQIDNNRKELSNAMATITK